MQADFKDIKLTNLDTIVRNQINSKIKTFVYYLNLDGYDLNKKQIAILKIICFDESEPIRNEIRGLIKQFLDEELFGKMEKSIGERIDELLANYKDWESSEWGKI